MIYERFERYMLSSYPETFVKSLTILIRNLINLNYGIPRPVWLSFMQRCSFEIDYLDSMGYIVRPVFRDRKFIRVEFRETNSTNGYFIPLTDYHIYDKIKL